MSRRFITLITLIMTICFLLLGIIFKSSAEEQRGVSASAGVTIGGQYIEMSSGRLGVNDEKYEEFNADGTIFFFLVIVTGSICVAMEVTRKKFEII